MTIGPLFPTLFAPEYIITILLFIVIMTGLISGNQCVRNTFIGLSLGLPENHNDVTVREMLNEVNKKYSNWLIIHAFRLSKYVHKFY